VFERRLRNALLKHCSAIIVAAEPNIAQFGLTAFAHKTRIIPFAPDRALVSMTDRTEATYTPPLPIPYMLFVGRLVHYKGLETFLPLMQHIHGYLVIAGDGPLYHSLSSLANSLSISSKVVLCGAVTDEELASLLRQALFCIMPSVSRSETFGIAALEAMACGKAVVVSRIGTGLDTLVHEGINGYSVDPSDPERWIDVCNHLFDDPALAQTLGFNGQNIAATKYSDTDTHDRVLALLNDANLRGCHCSQ
jgi:rhamnosyl/mannosyltransferase